MLNKKALGDMILWLDELDDLLVSEIPQGRDGGVGDVGVSFRG